MPESADGVVQVLDEIEHENQTVTLVRLKSRIEEPVVDRSGTRLAEFLPCRVGLDTLGLPELLQLVKE